MENKALDLQRSHLPHEGAKRRAEKRKRYGVGCLCKMFQMQKHDVAEDAVEGGCGGTHMKVSDEPGISIAFAANMTPFVLSNAQYLTKINIMHSLITSANREKTCLHNAKTSSTNHFTASP